MCMLEIYEIKTVKHTSYIATNEQNPKTFIASRSKQTIHGPWMYKTDKTSKKLT